MMKRLKRSKKTRFIALVMAVCMVISALYLSDRRKMALADDVTLTLAAIDDPSTLTGTGNVNVASGDLKIKLPALGKTDYSWSSETDKATAITDDTVSAGTTESEVYLVKKTVIPDPDGDGPEVEKTEYNTVYTLKIKNLLDDTKAYVESSLGNNADLKLSSDLQNFGDIPAEGYYGTLKFYLGKEETAPADATYVDYNGLKSAIDGLNGKQESESVDGTYYIHTKYTVDSKEITTKKSFELNKYPVMIYWGSIQNRDWNYSTASADLQNVYSGELTLNTYTSDDFDIVFKVSKDVDVTVNGTAAGSSENKEFSYHVGAAVATATSSTYDFVLKDKAHEGTKSATVKVTVSYKSGTPTISGVNLTSSEGKGLYGDTLYVKSKVGSVKLDATAEIIKPLEVNSIKISAATGSKFVVNSQLTRSENGDKYSYKANAITVDLPDEMEAQTTTNISISAIGSTGLASTAVVKKVALDTVAPNISSIKVIQDGSAEQTVLNTGIAEKSLTKMKPITLKFKPTDDFGVLDPNSVKVSSQDRATVTFKGVDADGYYIFEVSALGQNDTSEIDKYVITARDYAYNLFRGEYRVKLDNENIKITSKVKIADEDLAKIGDDAYEPVNSNKLIAEFTVTSVQPLDGTDPFVVDSASAAAKGITLTKLSETSREVKDDDGNIKEYVSVYTYEMSFSKSAEISDVTAVAKNKNGATDTHKLAIIRVDLSNPSVAVNVSQYGNTTGVLDPKSHQWYTNVVLLITATDDDGDWDSDISSITVKDNGKVYDFNSPTNNQVIYPVTPSTTDAGTPVEIFCTDKTGNKTKDSGIFKETYYVDNTRPTATLQINGQEPGTVNNKVLPKDPQISFSGQDNGLYLYHYDLTVAGPDETKVEREEGIKNFGKMKKLSEIFGGNLKDGTYNFSLEAVDYASNTINGDKISTSVIVDNTDPIVDVIIPENLRKTKKFDKYNRHYYNSQTGTSYDYGIYYDRAMNLQLRVIEENIDKDSIVVTANGQRLNISWYDTTVNGKKALEAQLQINEEGEYAIAINATDKAGNKAIQRDVSFAVDLNDPSISVSLNGSGIGAGSGERFLNTTGNVTATATDKFFDDDDFTVTVKRTTPDRAVNTSTEKITNGTTPYSTDADYEISYKVVDKAGRESNYGPIQFRVDKVAPKLEVSGAAQNGTSTNPVNAVMSIIEDFYWDMESVSAKIYKKVDGQGERLLEDVKVNPTSARTSISKNLSDDGEYRFEMEATDKCGNHSTLTYSFLVDANAPLVELGGVKNYDSTDKAVDLTVKVTEDFYTTNKLVINGTRKGDDGKEEKLNFSGYNVNSARITTIPQQFKEDGVYDIEVKSTDKAGNSDSKKVHFTIDSKAPVIKALPEYDGTLLKAFNWNYKLDELVSDLTVCDVNIYMDGVEYDGKSELTDGSHILRIEAVDELGHESSVEYSFVVDTKGPTILVAGVEDGDRFTEDRVIDISLQLDEDMLRSVTINGEQVTISNNTCTININKKGGYELKVSAVDKAGNESDLIYNFTYGTKLNWWMLAIPVAAALLLIIILLILIKRRKDKEAA